MDWRGFVQANGLRIVLTKGKRAHSTSRTDAGLRRRERKERLYFVHPRFSTSLPMSEQHGDQAEVMSGSPVASKTPPALLQCVDRSVLKDDMCAQIMLDEGEVSVGRDAKNQASLHAQGVSRFHARVFFENGAWAVEDLGSANGTRVNNSKLEEIQSLKHGDTVAFGRACYKFQLHDDSEGAAAAIDIDLGAAEQIMATDRAAQLPGAAAVNANPDAQANAPRIRATPAARSAETKTAGSSNLVLWLIVTAVFAALVIGGANLLGFL